MTHLPPIRARRLREAVVAIVGLGQIGASLGRALVARRACRRVIGVSRRAGTLRTALRLRAAHEVSRDLRAACARADIVVLAAPVRAILRLLPATAAAARPGTLLMDVGSTKASVAAAAARAVRPRGLVFVGGHPMAGTEGRGPDSSNPRLFVGRPFVLCPLPGTPRAAVARAQALARATGARALRLDPADHDALVARISHLPHAVAVALALEAAAFRRGAAVPLAAGSFGSGTRVAAADTDMLVDIFLTNGPQIAASIRALARRLGAIGRMTARRDARGLARVFGAARRLRRGWNR